MKVDELLAINEAKKKKPAKLSADDKHDIIEDFKVWSGGFTPDEMPAEEISNFVQLAMDSHYDADAARDYLESLT